MTDWISVIVYFFLFFVAPMTFYLKRTHQTFPEFIKKVIEFFREIGGEE